MATGIKAGKAFVELGIGDGLDKGLRKARAKIRRFGNDMGRLGSKFLGVGTALALPLGLAVKKASELQETVSKFNVVFGENRDAVREWGEQFASEIGRSRRQILSFLAETQDLFVPLGFEPGAAEEMSKQLTKLTIDLASFNNKADADVLRDLQAALTGSSEVMKKYGVLVNQTAVNQELLNNNMDPSTASEQAKVMARLNIIMRGTTAAQGDAERTAGSFANQMKRLNAELENAAGEIGAALLPAIVPLVKELAVVARSIGNFASENANLVRSIGYITAIILGTGGLIYAFSVSVKAALGLGAALGFIIKVSKGFSVMSARISHSWKVLRLIVKTSRALGVAMEHFFLNITNGLLNIALDIKNRFPALFKSMQNLFKKISKGAYEPGSEAAKKWASGFAKRMGKFFNKFARGISVFFKSIAAAIVKAIGLALTALAPVALLWGFIEGWGLLRDAMRSTAEVSDTLSKKLEDNNKRRKEEKKLLQELSDLNNRQRLTNAEQNRAIKIVDELSNKYGSLGISINKATGQLEGYKEAQAEIIKQQLDDEINETTAAMKEVESNISSITNEIKSIQTAMDEGSTGLLSGGFIVTERRKERVLELQRMQQKEYSSLRKHMQAIEKLRSRKTSDIQELTAKQEEQRSKEAIQKERELQERIERLRIEQIENTLKREIALINHRYDKEREEIKKVGGDLELLEKARKIEIEEAIKKSDEEKQQEEARRREEKARKQQEKANRLAEIKERNEEQINKNIRLRIQLEEKGIKQKKMLLDLDEEIAIEEAKRAGENVNLIKREFELRRKMLDVQQKAESSTSLETTGSFSAAAARQFLGDKTQSLLEKQLDELVAIRNNTKNRNGKNNNNAFA